MRVEPGIVDGVHDGLARLVADEVLLVLHVRPARNLAAAAARPGLDRVLDGVGAAVEVAVIGAVLEVRAAAGGGADMVARIIAQGISVPLGQQVVVDNRTGGAILGDIVSPANEESEWEVLRD